MAEEREKLIAEIAKAMADGKLLEMYASCALSVIEANGGYAPEGKWIAPDEPTTKMLHAGGRAYSETRQAIIPAIYRAMRQAAKE